MKPMTPDEILEAADYYVTGAIALPESDRQLFLQDLKQVHPVMHALVKSKMTKLRDDANKPRD